MQPPVSVIVPFYDETMYVRAAVWSVLGQGIDGAEILLVNDNPEVFGPAEIARIGLPGAVRILHHDRNRGLSAARNTGMAAATGRYVGFLDADDYYTAGGLARHLAAAQGQADIIHAQTYLSQPGSPAVRVLRRDADLFARPRSGAGLRGVEEAQFIVSSWSSLYRRGFLEATGLRFDEEQVKFEDRLFVLQAVTAARKIVITGAPARVWRRRAGSISVTPTDAALHLLQVQLLEKCMAHLRAAVAQGLPPRFLKRELFNTVSRLIWDMDLVAAVAQGGDPAYAALGARVPALLGDESFHQRFFDDPVARQVSRVGMATRAGTIGRADFFALHAGLREGRFGDVAALLAVRRDAAAAVPARARPARGRRG